MSKSRNYYKPDPQRVVSELPNYRPISLLTVCNFISNTCGLDEKKKTDTALGQLITVSNKYTDKSKYVAIYSLVSGRLWIR